MRLTLLKQTRAWLIKSGKRRALILYTYRVIFLTDKNWSFLCGTRVLVYGFYKLFCKEQRAVDQ